MYLVNKFYLNVMRFVYYMQYTNTQSFVYVFCKCVCISDLIQCILWYFSFKMRSHCNETMLNGVHNKIVFCFLCERNYKTDAKIGTLFAPWFIRPLILVASLYSITFRSPTNDEILYDWMYGMNIRSSFFFSETHARAHTHTFLIS